MELIRQYPSCSCQCCTFIQSLTGFRHQKRKFIFLNDFQYNDGRIKWNLFLNFSKGAPTSVAMPKNYFAFDVDWTKCQPLFAIAEKKIVNKSCQQEHQQRWDVTGGWKKYAYNSTINLHMEKSIMTRCPALVTLLGFYLKFKQTHYSIYIYIPIFLNLDLMNKFNFMLTVYTCKLL